MTTSARIGWNTILKRGNGATPEVFTSLGEVTGISDIGESRPTHTVTHMESPEGKDDTILGNAAPSEMSVTLNFLPGSTAQQGLKDDFDNQTQRNFQLNHPDPAVSAWTFTARVSAYRVNIEAATPRSISFTLSISTSGIDWNVT